MKKFICLFVLLTFPLGRLMAQTKIDNITINYGDEISDNKNKIIGIVGEANERIYTTTTNMSEERFIKVFDSKTMKQLSEKRIVMPRADNGTALEYHNTVIVGGKVYVLGQAMIPQRKTNYYYAMEVSADGDMSSNKKALFESKVYYDRIGNFYFRNSPDGKHLAIIHTLALKKEDAMQYEIKLLDSALNPVFSATNKFEMGDGKKDYQFCVADFGVNGKNDVIIVANESYRDKKNRNKVENFQLDIYKAAGGYKKEVATVNVIDNEVINCNMIPVSDNTLKLVGLYSSVRENGKANKTLKGVYNIVVNLDKKASENSVFTEFDYNTRVKLLGKGRADRGKELKPYYDINSIIQRNDGGLIVVSEYHNVRTGKGAAGKAVGMLGSLMNSTSGLGGLGGSGVAADVQRVTVESNEMIITSLKPDGTLDWANVLPKKQDANFTSVSMDASALNNKMERDNPDLTVSDNMYDATTDMSRFLARGPEYLNGLCLYNNGQLSVLFNDNPSNKGVTDIEKMETMTKPESSSPALFTYNSKGEVTRKDPEELSKDRVVMRPAVFYQVSDKEFIIYASNKGSNKLGRMVIK